MTILKEGQLPSSEFTGALYKGHRGIFVSTPAGWCFLLNDTGRQKVLAGDHEDSSIDAAAAHMQQLYPGLRVFIQFTCLSDQFSWFAAGE